MKRRGRGERRGWRRNMDSSTGETGSCCSSSSSIPFFFFDFMYIHFYFLSCGCRHDTCLYQKRREKEIRVRETYKFLLQVFFFIISSFFFTLVFQSGSSLVCLQRPFWCWWWWWFLNILHPFWAPEEFPLSLHLQCYLMIKVWFKPENILCVSLLHLTGGREISFDKRREVSRREVSSFQGKEMMKKLNILTGHAKAFYFFLSRSSCRLIPWDGIILLPLPCLISFCCCLMLFLEGWQEEGNDNLLLGCLIISQRRQSFFKCKMRMGWGWDDALKKEREETDVEWKRVSFVCLSHLWLCLSFHLFNLLSILRCNLLMLSILMLNDRERILVCNLD